MKKLQFGDLLTIIQHCEKERKYSEWTKQENIVNDLFSLFDIQKIHSDKKELVDYHVSSTQCSQYFLCEKNIPKKIRKVFSHFPIQQIEDDICLKLQEKNVNFGKICQKIKKLYNHEQFITLDNYKDFKNESEELDKAYLSQLYNKKNYPRFFANVLIYTIFSIPNIHPDRDTNNLPPQNFDIQSYIKENRYYLDYDRTIIISPDCSNNLFQITMIKKYLAYYPNPKQESKTSAVWSFDFPSETMRNHFHINKLTINGKDYQSKLNIKSTQSEPYQNEPIFQKSFSLDNIKPKDIYSVELVTTMIAKFPIFNSNFKLTIPAKKLNCSLIIRGQEKYKLNISANYFGDYSQNPKINNKIEPDSDSAYFEIKNWILPTFGICYLVKPRDKFWKDFIL